MTNGWHLKELGEVCDLATGGTPSRSNPEFFGGDIRWLVSGDIHKGEIFDCEGRITESGMKASNAKLLPVDSVMIALNGQGKTRGTVALLRVPATCNQSLVCITPKASSNVLPEFLFVNLQARYEELRRLTSDDDNDRRGLNMGIIKKITVPIPPVAEQRRIVAILHGALSAIATIKANVERNVENARELLISRQAEALAAAAQDSHAEFLESVVAPDCSLSYGIVQPGANIPHGLPVVRPVDLVSDTVELDGLKRIDPELAKPYSRTTLKGNDLLLCVRGTTGTVSVAAASLAGANVTRGIVPIRFDPSRVTPRLGYYLLRSDSFQGQIRAKTYGAALMQINIADLRKLLIVVPAIEKQASLVRLLDGIQRAANQLEATYRNKAAELNELKKTILYRAFCGQLTATRTASRLAEFA